MLLKDLPVHINQSEESLNGNVFGSLKEWATSKVILNAQQRKTEAFLWKGISAMSYKVWERTKLGNLEDIVGINLTWVWSIHSIWAEGHTSTIFPNPMDCALGRVEVRLVLNSIIQSDLKFLENGLQQEILITQFTDI